MLVIDFENKVNLGVGKYNICLWIWVFKILVRKLLVVK